MNHSIVIKRQEEPVLRPRAVGAGRRDVPNVVFSCGGIERDDKYLIYYGGADHVMAVAAVTRGEAMSLATVTRSEVAEFIGQ